MSPRTLRSASIAAAVVVVALLAGGAAAQTGSGGCTAALVSLSPCLNYITGNETTPSSSCCSQLAAVVQGEPQCLCAALGADASSLGLNINKTAALQLPVVCKVPTPPVSKCNSAAAPTAPASGTPAGQTPASTGTGSGGGGSKTMPATDLSSDGAALQGPVGFAVGLVVLAAYGLSAV